MSYVQYYGSILAPPLTDEERIQYEQLHEDFAHDISEANGRVLLGGVLTVPTNFEAVLAYLTQSGKAPQIYIAQNPDGSDYTVSIGEGDEAVVQALFPRNLEAYNSFFPDETVDDGQGRTVTRKRVEHAFGGWPMPNAEQPIQEGLV